MAIVRKIQNQTELWKALNLCAEAFLKKDPIFLFDKVPIKDFVDYYFSIRSSILHSPIAYALFDNNEIKATFIGLPATFKYQHMVPKSMVDYDEFFGKKYEENIKFLNEEKCFYAFFTASLYKGGARLIYNQCFKDFGEYGFEEIYYEISNPVNGKLFRKFAEEFKWEVTVLTEEFYKKKIKIEFCKAVLTEKKKNHEDH